MDEEPTPWEEINPPMVSAQRQELQSPSLERQQATNTFRNELTACLALVAPVGMTEEAKRDWLTVAWQTLSHIPPDILKSGCAAARQKCDHPSKIVPAIIEETRERMSWRKPSHSEPSPLRLSRPDYATPEQAAEILKEFGLKGALRP